MESEQVILRSEDDRAIDLGSRDTFLVATREINDWTAGSIVNASGYRTFSDPEGEPCFGAEWTGETLVEGR